jgi:hypothetical protein
MGNKCLVFALRHGLVSRGAGFCVEECFDLGRDFWRLGTHWPNGASKCRQMLPLWTVIDNVPARLQVASGNSAESTAKQQPIAGKELGMTLMSSSRLPGQAWWLNIGSATTPNPGKA